MYLKPVEIRWNDLDANRHLGNTAFISFMSHTRMAFFHDLGFTLEYLNTNDIGPVVFYEHVYYLNEVLPGNPVQVSLEINGLSADGMFFEFYHNMYNHKGVQVAHAQLMGGWMNLTTRKLTCPTPEMNQKFNAIEKGETFRVLTQKDTRPVRIPRKDLP
jgi:acyl-CoA thioester hydrolase